MATTLCSKPTFLWPWVYVKTELSYVKLNGCKKSQHLVKGFLPVHHGGFRNNLPSLLKKFMSFCSRNTYQDDMYIVLITWCSLKKKKITLSSGKEIFLKNGRRLQWKVLMMGAQRKTMTKLTLFTSKQLFITFQFLHKLRESLTPYTPFHSQPLP